MCCEEEENLRRTARKMNGIAKPNIFIRRITSTESMRSYVFASRIQDEFIIEVEFPIEHVSNLRVNLSLNNIAIADIQAALTIVRRNENLFAEAVFDSLDHSTLTIGQEVELSDDAFEKMRGDIKII